nr:MAG TPA: hypothetical protein [Caudoviricetes sp.]
MPSPARALFGGIDTPCGVCCGFGQACRGPVCNPLCGITSQSSRLYYNQQPISVSATDA